MFLQKTHRRVFSSALALVSCLGLAACNGSTTSPTPATIPNISGDYSGTMVDAQGGSGSATATLAQHGATAGGAITTTQGGSTLTAQLSLAIASSNAFSGAMVVNYTSGATCTFNTSGTYNASTYSLNGSYAAVTGCTGDTGTYALAQQCTDTVTSSERRPQFAPPAQC
ncbi:MAG TPA: hypothetical protein VIJ12_04765 [Candidatus Baltobacteraceae bacterium]